VLCLQDVLEVEEYLWRYIVTYHSDKVQSICSPGVTYTYAKDDFSHKLDIKGGNVEAVKTAAEEFITLCQKVADHVAEETFSLPQDTHEDMLRANVCDLAENEKLLFYVSHNNICHVVGPKEKVSVLKQRILDVISVDANKAEGANRKSEKIPSSEAIKASPSPGSMPERYSMITPGGIKVEVYQGNLVVETVDAIVNPANSYLRHGSGAARAIADAAGMQLEKECKDFIEKHKHLNVTEVVHTSAGKLKPKIRYVIHAVGPQAAMYPDAMVLFQALKETFINCLQYADIELHASSLSVPAISSGRLHVTAAFV